MFGTPKSDLAPNTLAFEEEPLIAESGFREYDARWLYPKEINLIGMQALGLALGHYFRERGIEPKVVTGHDFRSYSLSLKQALTLGLMSAGCHVHDIGLALSPVAYFAQFALDAPAVAMVTASHNENGWTGVKMGAQRPLTFGPEEMSRLRQIVFSGEARARSGGFYTRVEHMRETYLQAVTAGHRLSRPIRVVAACGNGTAGAFAPEALRRIGADVIAMDAELDWDFPKYNPNPEDLRMLHAMGEKLRETGAEIALGFDGDGDRCGVVDDEGHELFADKVGVLLARDLSARIKSAKFVVDVKSTGLFETDPVLRANGAVTDYWKTGHSYIKRRTAELSAVAGLEKSGHYFFNPPIGRGYDDSIVAAIAILEMLDRSGKRISALARGLPETWGSPTMAPFCPDERKYRVVEAVTKDYERIAARGESVLGQKIARLVTVNGVRVTLQDGTWGLVRASSNKPSLVVVCESPVSLEAMHAMFRDIDARLKKFPEVGEYDQKI
jgi:phosphomannomutase / phosphoglucomutase